MNQPDLLRRVALLENTLRELLGLARAAERCSACVPPSEAFEGKHAVEWERLVKKAYGLLPPTA